MTHRSRSSLDYQTLLHELQMEKWRKALLGGRVDEAAALAARLSGSPDKFWRWLGKMHLGLCEIAGGRIEAGMLAFSEAERTHPSSSRFSELARENQAHVLLSLGAAESALTLLGPAAEGTRNGDYWRALALARLGRLDESRVLLARIAAARFCPALVEHLAATIESESEQRAERLEHACRAGAGWDPAYPIAPIRFELGGVLMELSRSEEALQHFDAIAADEEVLLQWPLPYVRSCFRAAELWIGRDDERARAGFARFLLFRARSDVESEDVERARQFVKA